MLARHQNLRLYNFKVARHTNILFDGTMKCMCLIWNMICCFLLIFHLLLLICFLINFSIYINNRYHFMLILLHHWSKRLYVMIFLYRMLIHVVWYQLLIFNWHYQLNMNLSVFCLKYCNHKQIQTSNYQILNYNTVTSHLKCT